MTVHVPGAFSLSATQRWVVYGWVGNTVRCRTDSVTDEGVSPLRGIPRGRAKTTLDLILIIQSAQVHPSAAAIPQHTMPFGHQDNNVYYCSRIFWRITVEISYYT